MRDRFGSQIRQSFDASMTRTAFPSFSPALLAPLPRTTGNRIAAAMVSTAEQVFAIPELLEHILLYLDDRGSYMTDPQHSRELFTLQRVSRSFNNTVRGSIRLKARMGLEYPLPEVTMAVRSSGLITPYLKNKKLKLTPFTVDEIYECFLDDIEADYDLLAIRLSYRPNGVQSIGLSGNSRTLYGRMEHSWRQLKVATIESELLLTVRVEFRSLDHECKEGNIYKEYLMGGERERVYTLGDIADLLDAISQRTIEEHAAVRAFISRKTSPSDEVSTSDEDSLGYESLGYEPQESHKTVQGFLQAASMRLAWMKFEYGPAMKRLTQDLSSNPDFWMNPPLEAMDEKIAWENRKRLLGLDWSSYHEPWNSCKRKLKDTGKIREIGAALEQVVGARSLAEENMVAGKIAGDNNHLEGFALTNVDSPAVVKDNTRPVYALKTEVSTATKSSQLTHSEVEEYILAGAGEDDCFFDTQSVNASASWETVSATESEWEYASAREGDGCDQTTLRSNSLPTISKEEEPNQPQSVEGRSKLVKRDEEEMYWDCGDGVEECSANRVGRFAPDTKGQDALGAEWQSHGSLWNERVACVQDFTDFILYGGMVVSAGVAVIIVWFLLKVLFSTWD